MRSPVSRLIRLASIAAIVATPPGRAAESQPAALQTNVQHAILIDAATGTVLFERGSDDLVTPASTAKIMTAEIVFELLKSGKLRPDQTLKVSETAWRQGGAPSHGSTMFAKLNSEVAVSDLLQGLIVDSANDAAIVLAEGIAGSQGAFATQMTQRARELGFPHMTFTDAWGDDSPDQKVTPREMALLTQHQIATFPRPLQALRPTRLPVEQDQAAQPQSAAGDGHRRRRAEDRQHQRLRLFDRRLGGPERRAADPVAVWRADGCRAFRRGPQDPAMGVSRLCHAQALRGRRDGRHGGRLRRGGAPRCRSSPGDGVSVLVPRESTDKLTAKIVYQGPLLAPVEAGANVASLKLYRGEAEVLSAPLRTGEAVAVGSLPKRALDAGLEYLGGLFPEIRAALVSEPEPSASPGAFITVEGGEGGGKSTQVRALVARLKVAGVAALATREPGGSPAAEALRETLLSGAFEQLGPRVEALLFAAARIDHLDAKIKPALARGHVGCIGSLP